MNQDKQDHYVYVLVDSEGFYRYIGEGRGTRYKVKKGRSEEYLKILATGEIVFLHENLTKAQARDAENSYLSEYIGKVTGKWNLINKVKNRVVAKISPELFKDYVKVDINSPSGLTWLVDGIDKNGIVNRRRIGKQAGTMDVAAGYFKVFICGVLYKNHRIVWSLHNNNTIDEHMVVNHIDSDGFNNHPDNLEVVTYSVNSYLAKRQAKQNGFPKGVSKSRSGNCDYIKGCLKVNGKDFSRCFSIRKYGEAEAFRLACAWRKSMEEKHYN